MAATVVFVHGTGVRAERCLATFERVRDNITGRRPEISVLACSWGDRLGAVLNAGGVSVPQHPGRAGSRAGSRSDSGSWSGSPWPGSSPDSGSGLVSGPEPGAEQEGGALPWGLLEADPLHELRMIALIARQSPATGRFVVGAEPAEVRLADRLRRLPGAEPIRAELAGLGLLDEFTAAVPALLSCATAQEALRLGPEIEVARALARAAVAEAFRRAAAGPRGAVPITAARREQLLLLVAEAMGAADLGIGSALGKAMARLAWQWAGAGVVERRRGAITDAAHPMAGDIVLYLSRGERIRRFIRDCCRDAEPPVVLLAHSLGGVACLDLLATEPVPGVARLVTVGSQAPFLYELDALPSLSYGEPLPEHLPPWTNFYDPRDLLAYVGAGVFPGRVADIAVPSGNPFPYAHGDYFGNPAFYDRFLELVP